MEQKPDSLLMLVDDESLTLEALTRLFRDHHRCISFTDPKDALVELQNGLQPQIILADFSLPQQNGLSFLAEARQLSPQAVRCLFSGQMNASSIHEALSSGIINRFFHKPWDNRDLQLHMAECLELYKLMQLATSDPLTKLLNRRGLYDQLAIEFERAKRHSRHLSILSLDLDHFKDINDSCGHAAGDEAVRQAAKIFRSTIRNIDLVGRIGGDEFMIVLPDTDLVSAKTIAERICSKFQITYTPGFAKSLSISIGIAGLPRSARAYDELIVAADRALYRAKTLGKNRVEVESPSS